MQFIFSLHPPLIIDLDHLPEELIQFLYTKNETESEHPWARQIFSHFESLDIPLKFTTLRVT